MGRVFIPTDETFPRTADAVVIGGGIVGVATAFWLSRAGLDTVLLEMRDGLSTLTTPNSIESFRAQFTEPAMSALVRPRGWRKCWSRERPEGPFSLGTAGNSFPAPAGTSMLEMISSAATGRTSFFRSSCILKPLPSGRTWKERPPVPSFA